MLTTEKKTAENILIDIHTPNKTSHPSLTTFQIKQLTKQLPSPTAPPPYPHRSR